MGSIYQVAFHRDLFVLGPLLFILTHVNDIPHLNQGNVPMLIDAKIYSAIKSFDNTEGPGLLDPIILYLASEWQM